MKVLHGEQYIELYKGLPTSGNLESHLRVVDILDKKSGALVIINGEISSSHVSNPWHLQIWNLEFAVDVLDESKEKVLSAQFGIFVVGSGGFGGKRSSEHIVPTVDAPKRNPDASVQYKTSIDQVWEIV